MSEPKDSFYTDTLINHEITEKGPGEYRWGQPGTNIYTVYIILRPGAVIIYGDVGEFIFRHSDDNSLRWLKGAVKSRDYLLGKLRTHNKTYDPDRTKEMINETLADWGFSPKEEFKAKEDFDRVDFTSEYEVIDFLQEYLNSDCELLIQTWDANSSAIWSYWILKTFIERLIKEPSEETPIPAVSTVPAPRPIPTDPGNPEPSQGPKEGADQWP